MPFSRIVACSGVRSSNFSFGPHYTLSVVPQPANWGKPLVSSGQVNSWRAANDVERQSAHSGIRADAAGAACEGLCPAGAGAGHRPGPRIRRFPAAQQEVVADTDHFGAAAGGAARCVEQHGGGAVYLPDLLKE